jgi:magnesium-transporting ATPase (P-type)
VDTTAGLDLAATGPLSIESRRETFGSNKFKEVKPKNFFILWFENLCDPTLILLMVAAAVSLNNLGSLRWFFFGASDEFSQGLPIRIPCKGFFSHCKASQS